MSGLQKLYLAENHLSGTLPAAWSNMTGLQVLDLHQTGCLGDCRTEPHNRSSDAGFEPNQLSGSLPAAWSNMTGLQVLSLHQNRLSGDCRRRGTT